MAGEMEVLFSLAGRMHVLLRRESNRIIDVEWLCSDAAYAHEIIGLALRTESDELHRLAERIGEVHPLLRGIERRATVPQAPEAKYVATLR